MAWETPASRWTAWKVIGSPRLISARIAWSPPSSTGSPSTPTSSNRHRVLPAAYLQNDSTAQTRELTSALGRCCPSAGTFASHEMKDATELAVGVSSAGFEFDCGRRRYLL